MSKIEKLDKQKLAVLQLYRQLELSKFGKTKKEKYREIAKRMKTPENTIISWVKRYYDKFLEWLDEIKTLDNANICNFDGLTEKQTAYVIARLHGNSPDRAKEIAGYSSKTKTTDIEKHPKIQAIMLSLREKLKDDVVLGAESIVNKLYEINELGTKGIEVVETSYKEEHSAKFGRTTSKDVTKKRLYNLNAAQSALKTINAMLGYDFAIEMKIKEQEKESENLEKIVKVADDDF